MINTLDKKSKNILITDKERGALRHEIIELFCAGKASFSLEKMEEKYPRVSELFVLLSLRN